MNYLAIFVTGIINMVLGYLYYLPSLFGTKWANFVGMDPEKTGKFPWYEIVIGVGLTFIQAFAVAWLIKQTNTATIAASVKMAIIVWLGFVVVTSLSWFSFGKNTEMFFINNLYYLISFTIMFIILTIWN